MKAKSFRLRVVERNFDLSVWRGTLPAFVTSDSHPVYTGGRNQSDRGPGMVMVAGSSLPEDEMAWSEIARKHFFLREVVYGTVIVADWKAALDEYLKIELSLESASESEKEALLATSIFTFVPNEKAVSELAKLVDSFDDRYGYLPKPLEGFVWENNEATRLGDWSAMKAEVRRVSA